MTKVRFERNPANGNLRMIVDRRVNKKHKYVALEFADNDAHAIRDGLTLAIEKLDDAL